jgi:hypothetical protein
VQRHLWAPGVERTGAPRECQTTNSSGCTRQGSVRGRRGCCKNIPECEHGRRIIDRASVVREIALRRPRSPERLSGWEACDPGGDQPESAGLGRDAPTRGIRHATISVSRASGRIAAVIHPKQIIGVPRQPLQGKGAQLSSVTRAPVLEDSKHKKESICILCAQLNAIYLQFTARARKVCLAYSQHVYRLLHHLVHNLPRGLDFLDDTRDLAHQERDINILSIVHVLR